MPARLLALAALLLLASPVSVLAQTRWSVLELATEWGAGREQLHGRMLRNGYTFNQVEEPDLWFTDAQGRPTLLAFDGARGLVAVVLYTPIPQGRERGELLASAARDLAGELGVPVEQSDSVVAWRHGETLLRFSVSEGSEYLSFALEGPGAEDEWARRGELQAQGAGFVPLDSTRWEVISEDAEQRVAVDHSRVERPSQGVVRVWERIDFSSGQRTGRGVVYDEELHRVEFDCPRSRVRVLSITLRHQGRVAGSMPPGDMARWSEILPETLGEAGWEAFCRIPEAGRV